MPASQQMDEEFWCAKQSAASDLCDEQFSSHSELKIKIPFCFLGFLHTQTETKAKA